IRADLIRQDIFPVDAGPALLRVDADPACCGWMRIRTGNKTRTSKAGEPISSAFFLTPIQTSAKEGERRRWTVLRSRPLTRSLEALRPPQSAACTRPGRRRAA